MIKSVRDHQITFNEENHSYKVNGDTYVSVTTLIHKYFPEFNENKIIEKMMASKNWSNSPYYGLSVQQIKDQWKGSRIEASQAGTELHAKIETYYNTVLDDKCLLGDYSCFGERTTKDIEYFINFDKECMLKPARTEWRVFTEDFKVAGSIDMIFHGSKPGTIKLYDWKRSKEIKMTNPFEKGFYPVDKLDHCNYSHYCLQLNLYKYILEKHYDLSVEEMALIVIHPNNLNYIKIAVPDLSQLVLLLLYHYKANK